MPNVDTPCDEWPGYRMKSGYGVIHLHAGRGGKVLAHRWIWEQLNGPIPDDLCVLHACDNPPCIRVSHLWLGTRVENNADRDAKGRQWRKNRAPLP